MAGQGIVQVPRYHVERQLVAAAAAEPVAGAVGDGALCTSLASDATLRVFIDWLVMLFG